MEYLIFICRLVLSGVFIVSGFVKLYNQKNTKASLENFRIPTRISSSFSLILPLIELFVAALLIFPTTSWWGAIASVVLLSIFTVVISVTLIKGEKKQCNCFGHLSKKPITWKALVRNIILMLLAGMIMAKRGTSMPNFISWKENFIILEQLLITAVIFNIALSGALLWFFLKLWYQHGRLIIRLEAMESVYPSDLSTVPDIAINGQNMIGEKALDFELPDIYGTKVELDSLLAQKKSIFLFFIDPHCGPCNSLLPLVGRWQQVLGDKYLFIMVSRGNIDDNLSKAIQFSLKYVLMQKEYEVALAYQVRMTPSAVLIESNKLIKSPVVAGLEAITALVAQTVKTANGLVKMN